MTPVKTSFISKILRVQHQFSQHKVELKRNFKMLLWYRALQIKGLYVQIVQFQKEYYHMTEWAYWLRLGMSIQNSLIWSR